LTQLCYVIKEIKNREGSSDETRDVLAFVQGVRWAVASRAWTTNLYPVVLSCFRILVRAISYTVHGLIPASCVFADRYNREEVVRSLGKEVNINPPLTLGQLPDTPEELLKLDQVSERSYETSNLRMSNSLRVYV
jgi:hypothetical protein